MRLNDGSICASCKHFEHECRAGEDFDCLEYCLHGSSNIMINFQNSIVAVEECEGYEEW